VVQRSRYLPRIRRRFATRQRDVAYRVSDRIAFGRGRIMSQHESTLTPKQRQAVDLLAAAESNAVHCESEAAAGWFGDDPDFFASLNRAKSYRMERLRADVRSLASDAIATLRELVSSPDVPPAVRLRAPWRRSPFLDAGTP
jgi:hypothetical protein